MYKLSLPILILFVFSSSSCTSTKRQEDFGLSSEHIGYIPAKISVLKCLEWPNQSIKLGEINITSEIRDNLCIQFNKFVISGFKDQPFMKGYTPKAVNKLLNLAQKPNHLNQIPVLWDTQTQKCKNCNNAASIYKSLIRPNSAWIEWLNQFSRSTKYSDALLMPLLISANKQQIDDKGLLISKNSAHVVMILIDTNNGKVIWSNQRSAEVSNKSLRQGSKKFPEFPHWNKIEPILFSDTIWEGFPGKQTF